MIIFPNAKINIGLNVLNRRPDGYHNLETIFYPITIKDALEIVIADKLSFQSTGLQIPGSIDDNLCIKAYGLIRKDFELPPVKIHLHKHIPVGAGLGGGSADAAFFIKLLNQTFDLGLTDDRMIGYAKQLGADCAFFIQNKPIFAFEKGDEFESIKLDLSKYKIITVMPPIQISTSEAFNGIRPQQPKDSLLELIYLPVPEWKNHIKNDFETAIFKDHIMIRWVKAALYEAGALYASMSGSGASVFGIFDKTPDLSELGKNNQVFY